MGDRHATACVVVGAGGHARAVLGVLQEPENFELYDVVAVLDARGPRGPGESVLKVPIVRSLADCEFSLKGECSTAFLAVGDNQRRSILFAEWSAKGFQLPNLVSRHALVHASVSLGAANFVAPFAHVGPLARIGNNNLLNTYANIEHDVSLGSHNHIAPGATLLGGSSIADRCFVGSRAVVLEKTRLAADNVVGAGAVVTRSCDQTGRLLVGVPARVIK